MNSTERPYRRPVQVPRAVRAPHQAAGGARTPRLHDCTQAQRARAADPKGDRTEPAERTDRMEWRTGRGRKGTEGRDNPYHTHRGKREGRGKHKGGGRRTGTAPPPKDLRERRAHTSRAVTWQGSSGAQRHAPAPQLGSLCAIPWGSQWRQASSTGRAARAPGATTH